MKHNVKQEFNESMDSLRFSPAAKAAMADRLAARMKENSMKNHKNTKNRFLLVALAAAMVVATLTGAAVFTRWSETAQQRYNPSQDVKEQAAQSGLSSLLEETQGADQVLSVTDQGITVTAVQTIVDNYGAQLTFRVEGFDLPEGRLPFAWPTVTIDGKQDFYVSQTGAFFDGTTQNENGDTVYAATGQPVASDENGCLILDYVAEDGSMEFTHHIGFQETDGRYFGKEIAVKFSSFDVQSEQKAGPSEPLVEGNWELKWTLTGADTNIKTTPNAEIGSSGVILLDAEIGQLSIKTRYQLKDYWEGWDELVDLPQAVCGVRMKDGTEHICVPTSWGYEDEEKLIVFVEGEMFDTILDLSQVESLMFHKGWEKDENGELTVQTFHYIPID